MSRLVKLSEDLSVWSQFVIGFHVNEIRGGYWGPEPGWVVEVILPMNQRLHVGLFGGDGWTRADVDARVEHLRDLVEEAEQTTWRRGPS